MGMSVFKGCRLKLLMVGMWVWGKWGGKRVVMKGGGLWGV